MQKRNLIIFSLFVISILLIAGCQETVGGVVRTQSIKYLYSSGSDSLNVGLEISGIGSCNLPISGPVSIGEDVKVSYVTSGGITAVGDSCYRVVGCMSVLGDGKLNDRNTGLETKFQAGNTFLNTFIPLTVLVIPFDQNICSANTIVDPIEITLVGGQAYTGF